MTDSLADFQNRLYSIRPFLETESPPSSASKQPRELSVDLEGGGDRVQIGSEAGPDLFKELTPLRRAVS
jgi:hypothetical protein